MRTFVDTPLNNECIILLYTLTIGFLVIIIK